MSGASLFHEAAQPRRLREDFDNAPTQERMGPQRVPRRNPSTDQKKARTQMARQSTKESTMAPEKTEAQYLAEMHSAASLTEQQALAAELAALRQRRAAELRAEASYGSIRQASARVSNAPSFAKHSIATDWLAEAAQDTADARTVEAQMRAEASIWYEGRPEAVKASPEEVRAQAHGFASRVASQHGTAAAGARAAFLAQVEHLSKVAMDEVQKPPYGVPSGSSLPEGVDNKDTFDDPVLSAPGGQDPQTEPGDSESLSEGDAPEGDTSQGVENPAADTTHDTVKSTEYVDPLTSGGKTSSMWVKAEKSVCPNCSTENKNTNTECSNCGWKPGDPIGKGASRKTGARHLADDQTSTEADDAVPSLSEGDAPEGDAAQPSVLPAKGTGHDAGPGNDGAIDSIDGTAYPKQASLRAIAASITPSEASAPFVSALATLDSVESSVAGISGREIVGYVLRTATLTKEQRTALEAHAAGVVPPFRAEAGYEVNEKSFEYHEGLQYAKEGKEYKGYGSSQKQIDFAAGYRAGGGFDKGKTSAKDDDSEPKTRAERADENPFEKDPGDAQDDWYRGDYEASLKAAADFNEDAAKAQISNQIERHMQVAGLTRDEALDAIRAGAQNSDRFVSEDARKAFLKVLDTFPRSSAKTASEYGGGSPKSGDTATCHADGGKIQFFDGAWYHLKGGPSHNDVYPATPKEQADKDAAAKTSTLRLDPTFAARVQASLSKEALPSYIDQLDPAEQYEVGYEEGDEANKKVPPYADGLEDGAEGKPRSRYHEYH